MVSNSSVHYVVLIILVIWFERFSVVRTGSSTARVVRFIT